VSPLESVIVSLRVTPIVYYKVSFFK